jgi:hypothetical protein
VSEKPEIVATKGQPFPSCTPTPVDSAVPRAGQGGVLSGDSGLLRLELSGSRVLVGFNDKDIPDETRVARYRAQLLDFVQRSRCKALNFDLKGIKILPSRMLGFFVTLKNEGHDIELVNMEQGVQDIFRITKLAPLFTIRPVAK